MKTCIARSIAIAADLLASTLVTSAFNGRHDSHGTTITVSGYALRKVLI